jgi:hypothetical protein
MPRPAHYGGVIRVRKDVKLTSTYRENEEADDPDPYGHTIRTALSLAEPCARRQFRQGKR